MDWQKIVVQVTAANTNASKSMVPWAQAGNETSDSTIRPTTHLTNFAMNMMPQKPFNLGHKAIKPVMLGQQGQTIMLLPTASRSRIFQRLGTKRRLFLMLADALALGLSVLSGCAYYKPHPINPQGAQEAFLERSLADIRLKAFLEANQHKKLDVWPQSAWDLTNLTLAAFFFHPDLEVARAQWATAKGGEITAAERPNPSLNVTPGYNTTTSVPSPWLPLGTLDIPLETAGKRGHRIAQAAHLAEAARLNIASIAWQVRSGVRRTLVGFYTAQEMQALLQEQQVQRLENLRLLEGQYKIGAISASELTLARIAVDEAGLTLRDAEQQSSVARLKLAEAIGIPADSLKNVRFSFKGLTQLPSEAALEKEARQRVLLLRSDILGALEEYLASEVALQLEISKQYPDIHLTPGYQYDQGDNKWSIGLTVTLPLLNQNRGAIAEAEAKRLEAEARFKALQARVLAALDLAVANYTTARKKAIDAETLLTHLKMQGQMARGMLGAGEISKSELVGLQLQLTTSALARLDAFSKAQQALGALEDAVQSPLGLPPSLPIKTPRPPHNPNGDQRS